MKAIELSCIHCDGTGSVVHKEYTPKERVIELLKRTSIANENYLTYHAGVKKRTLIELVNTKKIKRHKKGDPDEVFMYSLVEKK